MASSILATLPWCTVINRSTPSASSNRSSQANGSARIAMRVRETSASLSAAWTALEISERVMKIMTLSERHSIPIVGSFLERDRVLAERAVRTACARERDIWGRRGAARPAVQSARFTITGGKIVQVDVVADPARLRELDLAVLDDRQLRAPVLVA